MATQDQVVSVSLQKGLETKTDLKQGINGRLLTLENAVFTGVTDIEKRNGYTALPNAILSGGNITTGNSLGVFSEQTLLTFDGQSAYSYSPQEASNVYNGLKIATKISSQSIGGAVTPYFWPSVCYGDVGTKLVITPSNLVTPDQTKFNAIYFDTENTTLFDSYLVTTGSNITSTKTVPVGSKFIVLTASASQAQLTSFNQSPPATSAPAVTMTSTSVPPDMDTSGTDAYVLVYDGTHIQLSQYNSTLTLVNTTAITPTAAPISLNLVYDPVNSEILVGYLYAGGGNISRYNSSSLAFIASSVTITDSGIQSGSANNTDLSSNLSFATNGTDLGYFYDQFQFNAGAYYTGYITSAVVSTYRTTPTTQTVNSFGANYKIYSKAFYNDGLFYCGLIYFGAFQSEDYNSPQSFAKEGQTGIMLVGINYTIYTGPARIAYDSTFLYLSEGAYNGGLVPANPIGLVQWSDLSLPYFNAIQDLGVLVSGSSLALEAPIVYDVFEADLEFSNKLRNLSLGKNLNITGGTPFIFDGAGVAEQGFNNYPEILQISNNSSGTNHSYSYVVVYTWYDFQGNLHRSSPSIPRVMTTASPMGGSVGASLAFLGLGISEAHKAPNVQCQIYRTTDNGTVYYLIRTTENSATTALAGIEDQSPDTYIIGAEQLYTTGQEVDNIAPPSFSLITEFKNRQIGVNDQDPLQWWFSKQVIEGFPVEFSDTFTQNIDQKGGPITALSTMDDKLVFFKGSNVWYVIGDGPAPNGQNNDFTYPQLVSSDTGCANQDSIILTPKGLMFQSPKGIYLLDRGLGGMSYIGSPVEAYNQYTVSSVQMIARTNQVRFTLLEIPTCLVYDYFVDQWSVFLNTSAVDSVIFDGEFTFLNASGINNIEVPGSYLDNGAIIPMNFTTGWLKLSDIQGFERFKKMLIIGTSSGNSTINISFNYDYNASNLVNISPIPVTANLNRMQYRIFPPRQKCEAFQLVYVETPSTSSAGVTQVSNLALEIGIKKGPFKMPAAQSFG